MNFVQQNEKSHHPYILKKGELVKITISMEVKFSHYTKSTFLQSALPKGEGN